jgi:putative transmembrane protein Alph_Pro_TM
MPLVDNADCAVTAPIKRGLRRLLMLALVGCMIPAFVPCGFGLPSAEQDTVSLKLSPGQVRMGAFYNGSRMRIEGTAPAGSRVLVVIRGEEKDEIFNRKGRVGPIWLNTDKVHITNVPALFLSYGSDDVRSLLDGAVVDQYQVDEAAIKQRMSCRVHCKCTLTKTHSAGSKHLACTGVEPDARDGELLRANYLKLKADEGSYQTFPRAVRMAADAAGGARYSLEFLWPRKAPPGTYQVAVYAVRNRAIIAQAGTQLPVVEVGFPAFMARLASEHPWFYGLLAVVAAVVAGFGIDAIAVQLRKPRRRFQPSKVSRPESQPQSPAAKRPVPAPEEEHVHQ